MSRLLEVLNARAMGLGVPWNLHLDLTYRCNERCVHCYLSHEDRGELETGEVGALLGDLAAAGTLFLTLSGGEPLLRRDLFEILGQARALGFNLKLKTNGILIGEGEAERLRRLGVEQVQISLYSHRAEVHEAITGVRGSHARTLAAVRRLRAEGLRVSIASVLMRPNQGDYGGVKALAEELGAGFTLDPTLTPHLESGDRPVAPLRVPLEALAGVLGDAGLVGDVERFRAPPPPLETADLEAYPCSAGHSLAYISPFGDVYPCVQFPLRCGKVREQGFLDIWRHSPQLAEVRAVRNRHLTPCAACGHLGDCTRCPGLAFLQGDLRGPSALDCQQSRARTGIAAPTLGRMPAAESGPPPP